MPKRIIERIPINPLTPAEETRQLAEAIGDLHYTRTLLSEARKSWFPEKAWKNPSRLGTTRKSPCANW